jgi:hypothetical protein
VDSNKLMGIGALGIVARLAVISLIVGVVLSALGITPKNLYSQLTLLARRVYDLGFGAVEWGLQYMLVGAMVVVPIWLVAQVLTAMRKPRA